MSTHVMDMDAATTTHIKLNAWELFAIIVIVWFVISLWGDVFKSLIKHFVLAHNEPQPLVMAAIALVLTAALFAVTRIIGFNFITLVGKKPATKDDADE